MASVVAARGNKRFFVSLLSLYTGVTAYGCGCSYLRFMGESKRISENLKRLNNSEPLELTAQDHLHYPWYVNGIDSWEFQLVKLRGYFKDERIFVRRDRNGQPGYLVLAPFCTSNKVQDPTIRNAGINYPLEMAIMVSLGWVPEENKGDIEMGSEVLPLLDVSEELTAFSQITGAYNDPKWMFEDYLRPLTELTGIVRRGEEPSVLAGTRNWPDRGVFQSIDLDWMARFFRFPNRNASRVAYIERVVDSYESEPEDNYPVPATKDTYFKPNWLESHRGYLSVSEALGAASGAGLLGLLKVLAKQ